MSAISGGGGFHGDNHDQATTTATLPLNPAVATARKTARFGWHDNGECPTRPCQRQQAVATCGDDDFLPPLRTMVRRSGCRRPTRHHLVKKNFLGSCTLLGPGQRRSCPRLGVLDCWSTGFICRIYQWWNHPPRQAGQQAGRTTLPTACPWPRPSHYGAMRT